jgi:hypothetical protein
MDSSILPIILLRKATVQSLSLKLMDANGEATTDLKQATHIAFPQSLVSSDSVPASAPDGSDLVLSVDDPSGYKEYSILTLLYFLECRSLDLAVYIQRSINFWGESKHNSPIPIPFPD